MTHHLVLLGDGLQLGHEGLHVVEQWGPLALRDVLVCQLGKPVADAVEELHHLDKVRLLGPVHHLGHGRD